MGSEKGIQLFRFVLLFRRIIASGSLFSRFFFALFLGKKQKKNETKRKKSDPKSDQKARKRQNVALYFRFIFAFVLGKSEKKSE